MQYTFLENMSREETPTKFQSASVCYLLLAAFKEEKNSDLLGLFGLFGGLLGLYILGLPLR